MEMEKKGLCDPDFCRMTERAYASTPRKARRPQSLPKNFSASAEMKKELAKSRPHRLVATRNVQLTLRLLHFG